MRTGRHRAVGAKVHQVGRRASHIATTLTSTPHAILQTMGGITTGTPGMFSVAMLRSIPAMVGGFLKAIGHCRRPPCPRHRGIPRRYRRPPPSPGDSWGPLGTMSEASQSLSLFWLALLNPWRFRSVCPRPSQSNICAFQLLFGAYWSFLKPYQGALGVKSGPVAASSVKQKPLGIISDKSTII